MKKVVSLVLVMLLLVSFGVFAIGSGDEGETSQGSASAESTGDNTNLGSYAVTIDSCRLAEDYEGKPVVIVKYIFQNVSDEDGAAFYIAFEDKAFQAGVGLNKAYVLSDSANYSEDNQTKEIKVGATLEVEIAYELNDTTTPVEVEVNEYLSFNDKTLTKTFTIS